MFQRKLLLTLVLIRKENSILLGYKKRGFGAGKWNGFGGKVKEGETVLEGAMRELFEESKVRAKQLSCVGHLEFEFVGDPILLDVHVFSTFETLGEPQETDEMIPRWFPVLEIPYNEMWADDKYWFPLFLKGSKFVGYFKFLDHNSILEHTLKEVDDL